MVQRQALFKARSEVDAVHHSMALEDQSSALSIDNKMVRELAEQLMKQRKPWAAPKANLIL
jgi:hypothetical protein